MKSGYIRSGTQQLHYLRWDGGRRLLVAFHGYGNSASLFHGVASKLQPDYTTLSLDLPHHGRSDWQAEHPWQKQELVETFRALLQEYEVEKATVICFSIGGRMGLTLAEQCPELLDRLVLIAADGLVPNSFYYFVTRNIAGRKLFRHFLEKPEGYRKVFDWLTERKWIDPSRKKFVDYYTNDPAARQFLLKVWPNLRLIVPDLDRARQQLNDHGIRTDLFMGRFDRVIPLKNAYAFQRGLQHTHLHILDKSHRMMDDQTASEIAQILSVPS